MAHELLRRSHRHAGPCQHGPESRSKCMQIDLPTASVASSDPGPAAVSVEPTNQVGGDVEHPIGGAASLDAPTKHSDKIGSKWDRVVLAVFCGCRAQTDDRDRAVEIQVGDVQLPDFVDPQSGSRQERVEIGSAAS